MIDFPIGTYVLVVAEEPYHTQWHGMLCMVADPNKSQYDKRIYVADGHVALRPLCPRPDVSSLLDSDYAEPAYLEFCWARKDLVIITEEEAEQCLMARALMS